MTLQLCADDRMPWGKHMGHSLREVYDYDPGYYRNICSRPGDYLISNKTRSIVENHLHLQDESKLISNISTATRNEIGINDVIPWGIYKGKTLYQIYQENVSYIRFIMNSGYYISEWTLTKMKSHR